MNIKMRFTETPGNRLIHSRKKKNFGRPPRELQCSDRAQTSTTGSGRASCIDVVLRFWLKVLVRRDKFENRRKNHNYTYTYIFFWAGSVGTSLASHKFPPEHRLRLLIAGPFQLFFDFSTFFLLLILNLRFLIFFVSLFPHFCCSVFVNT